MNMKNMMRKIMTATATILCGTSGMLLSQGIGISESSITPDPSAVLEIRSTQRGLLIPRLSTAERNAIASPASGLLLYNTTTDRFNFRQGAWISLLSESDNLSALSSSTSSHLSALLSDETGSGSAVFSDSPVLTMPSLGSATAVSINDVTITDPGSSATLSLADGSSLTTSGANSITLTTTDETNVTLPTSGTLSVVREMYQISSDFSTTSTSLTDVTGMNGFSLEGNSTYYFKFRCLIETSGTNRGMLLSTNSSGAVTSINYIHMYPTSATAFTYEQVTVLQGGTISANGPGTTSREYTLEGMVTTSSSVTFGLQCRAEASGTAYVQAGSFGFVKKIQ